MVEGVCYSVMNPLHLPCRHVPHISLTVLYIVHHTIHLTSGTVCIYTYDTIHVLSCVGCDGEINMCTLVT